MKYSNTLLSDSVHGELHQQFKYRCFINIKGLIDCKEIFFYSAVCRKHNHTRILTKSLWQRTLKRW